MSATSVWLPFVGTCIIAASAFTSIYVSNRTNRAAITASDTREYVRWQREQVTVVATQIIETADLVIANCRGCGTWPNDKQERKYLEMVNMHTLLTTYARRLELLVGDDLDAPMLSIVKTTWECLQVARNTHHAVRTSGFKTELQDAVDAEAEKGIAAVRKFAGAVRDHVRTLG